MTRIIYCFIYISRHSSFHDWQFPLRLLNMYVLVFQTKAMLVQRGESAMACMDYGCMWFEFVFIWILC